MSVLPIRIGPIVTRLDRYIFRQLLLALVATTAGLVALIWLTQSLRFVELVVNRGLSVRVFLELSSLQIPYFVSVILPITTFVVVQFIYQRLSGDRELTVMRAAGLSPLALARPALAVALVAVACGYLLNLVLVPAASQAFRQYQFEIRNRVAAFLLQEGVFTPVSDDLTVYVRARDPDGGLRGILIEDARQKNNPATILAERGRLVSSEGAPRVLLINGSRQEIDRQTGRLNVLTFAENMIDLSRSERGEEQRFRDISEMSLGELLHPVAGAVLERDLPKLQVEANRRLASPLTTLTFTLVALVCVLMGTFRRHGGLVRPLLAVLAVVGLLASSLLLTNLAAKQAAMIPLIWVNAVLPGLVCAWALFGPQFRLVPVALQLRLGAS
ncbi:Lipopolysaccharide export system permease protein LptF [Rhodovastum atsumiense]|uniref:LPS export ABC transporter permease LptF n=1 Tax=Rhodovastum atsumiense TaxID=504468 RepID=A0A5M6IKJ2_9PROT|nr:LPS export ABC transporter permease LptF [Rhodovastum atsumiense]KAA5608702.1 LPS export ABC transporter permease LptF [Rhodovastum atsumiense]CAH2599116.1 Lipopolysaccharide export system permease protein LptF [Rhodovastum atsumiense]